MHFKSLITNLCIQIEYLITILNSYKLVNFKKPINEKVPSIEYCIKYKLLVKMYNRCETPCII